jgi:hypothetical protein
MFVFLMLCPRMLHAQIINLAGQPEVSGHCSNGTTLPLALLQTVLYFIRIQTYDQVLSKKFFRN